jgi:glycogen debranching enzyme
VSERVRLPDGSWGVLEPLRPEHKAVILAEYDHLSERSRYLRFLTAVPTLTPSMLHQLVDEVDGVNHQALTIAMQQPDGHLEPAGLARLIVDPHLPDAADVAVTVLDRWQGRGIGTVLLAALLRGRPPQVRRLVTTVSAQNPASLAMLRRAGVTTTTRAGPGILDVDSLSVLSSLTSEDGWVYASSAPVDDADPGRFHCLFGRDSLITALQVLPVRPQIAAATLRALAARQGTADDPPTDEQPGRILHEYRPTAPQWLVEAGWPVRDGMLIYYGTSDAVSWWLHLLATSGDPALRRELSTATAAAGRWLEQALADGRGFVRCGPRWFPGGLEHQGWRDARYPADDPHGGGIVQPTGSQPKAPLADIDSQAAAVAGLDALAVLQPDRHAHWSGLAARLRARLSGLAMLDPMAVDGDDAVVPGAGSQLGWLLWADALDEAATEVVVRRLLQPDLLTPFGVRTLSSAHPQFRATAYHRGAVWPFDNWFVWAGLRRIGHPSADLVRDGVLDALNRLTHYPELYSVDEESTLARVEIANQVQAWTVGAALAFDLDWTGRIR